VPLESKQMIELLLQHKANVNVLDSSGKTPLALAKERRLPVTAPASQHPEIVEEVIQKLKDNGANEALDRLTLIEVTRRGVRMSHSFGRAYANTW
jgi:ankyrin repeat protein